MVGGMFCCFFFGMCTYSQLVNTRDVPQTDHLVSTSNGQPNIIININLITPHIPHTLAQHPMTVLKHIILNHEIPRLLTVFTIRLNQLKGWIHRSVVNYHNSREWKKFLRLGLGGIGEIWEVNCFHPSCYLSLSLWNYELSFSSLTTRRIHVLLCLLQSFCLHAGEQ